MAPKDAGTGTWPTAGLPRWSSTGEQVAVQTVPTADAPSIEGASEEFLAKYWSSSYAASIVRPEVLETTLLLDPKITSHFRYPPFCELHCCDADTSWRTFGLNSCRHIHRVSIQVSFVGCGRHRSAGLCDLELDSNPHCVQRCSSGHIKLPAVRLFCAALTRIHPGETHDPESQQPNCACGYAHGTASRVRQCRH